MNKIVGMCDFLTFDIIVCLVNTDFLPPLFGHRTFDEACSDTTDDTSSNRNVLIDHAGKAQSFLNDGNLEKIRAFDSARNR